jgi:predicted dehydrogenase
MSEISRRSFVRRAAAGATTFTIVEPHLVRGAGKERLKTGLIGCGGRGTQAVVDLLSGTENVEIAAMADVFEDQLEGSLRRLRDPKFVTLHAGGTVERGGKPHVLTAEELATEIPERVKVDAEHRFTGFEAYKKLIASGVDIVMLATPPGYRPMHFEAAVEAGKHIFCEKPVGTDAVGVRRFMEAVRKSEQRKLTVVTGAQRHFQKEYRDAMDRIHGGGIGDIAAIYAYYLAGPVLRQRERNPKWGDMEWQHRQWYSYVWLCGDQIVEQHFHNIDACNWAMQGHPVKVVASGGAVWRPPNEIYGNIYDHLASDFEYANGVHLSSTCRQYPRGAYERVGEVFKGTSGVIETVRAWKGNSPYMEEHIALARSIRGDGPYINHGMMAAESTLTCIMGREAGYSGLEITWDQIMNSKQDLAPKAFRYDLSLEAPPLPIPGQYKFV